MMYAIVDNFSSNGGLKIIDNYHTYEHALVARNFIEWQESDGGTADDLETGRFDILEICDPQDSHCREDKWTSMDLQNAPRDIIIDLSKDLQPNNHVYRFFKEIREAKEEKSAKRQQYWEFSCAQIEKDLMHLKNTYNATFNAYFSQINDMSAPLQSLHEEVKLARRQVKKGAINASDLEGKSNEEKQLRKEIGKVKAKNTNLCKRCVKEMKKMMRDKNVQCIVCENGYEFENNRIVLTVNANAQIFQLVVD